MNISNDIFYIGVNDREIDLFEGQYDVPNGMAYNSYVIKDEKIAVMDTVDKNFTIEWLSNIKTVIKAFNDFYRSCNILTFYFETKRYNCSRS